MPEQARPIVRVTDVSKSFGHGPMAVTALRAVNLAVRPGELVCVVGPSGSGKSTLLSIVGGLLPPDTGTVQVGGTDVTVLPRQARARFRATHVPPRLVNNRTTRGPGGPAPGRPGPGTGTP